MISRQLIATFVLLTAGAGLQVHPANSASADQCGSWRWSVKTLSDPQAGRVSFSPVARTISQLRGLHPPAGLKASTPRSAPTETQVYRVRARLKEYTREADHDFHVVVAAPSSPSMTMVVEVVDPTCPGARDSARLNALRAVRQKFIDIYGEPGRGTFRPVPGQPVAILVGVGFFDQCGPQHKPRGAAPQCIELHPVLDTQTP